MKKENAFITTGKVGQEFYYIYTQGNCCKPRPAGQIQPLPVSYEQLYWDTALRVHLVLSMYALLL